MAANQTLYNTTHTMVSGGSVFPVPRDVRFWFLLLLDVPSTVCAIFVVFSTIIDQKLRNSVKNHALIAILIAGLAIQLFDVPLYLNYLVISYVIPATPLACLTWLFVDVGLYQLVTFLMAWISFERHIIVFHDHLLSTQKKRLLIHYVPLTVLILYGVLFYLCAICFYPCEYTFDYTATYCGVYPCFLHYPAISMFDLTVNGVAPILLEVFFSLSFLARVTWERYRKNLPIQWRKQRKMTIQLMAISIPNYALNFPNVVILLMHATGVPRTVGSTASKYLAFFMYSLNFIMPFICLVSIGNWKKVFAEKILRRQQRVTPS